MSRTKSIAELLHPKKKSAKSIKDYEAIERIFREYLNQYYDTMTREIAYYGRFRFFYDLLTYLGLNFKNEMWQSFFYDDIADEYTWRIIIMKTTKKNEFKTIY